MVDGSVLVLNSLYQAVHITSIRKAFALLYKGHVVAVDTDFRTYGWEDWCDVPAGADDDTIATPSMRIRIPHVVLLPHYDRIPRQEVRFTRKNIYFRDRNRCQYCGQKFAPKELNLDHVVPLSRGGKSTWDNVVCCCFACNHRKGNRLPQEARMRLVRRPSRPRWHPLVRLAMSGPAHDSWRSFLDVAYWNVELAED
jgi:5-methylcytosine-specific restriction endonuclease McrA